MLRDALIYGCSSYAASTSAVAHGTPEKCVPGTVLQVCLIFTARNRAATQAHAELMPKAQATDQAIGMADGLIAAIAQVNSMTVATRDTAPFYAVGVSVIDPWSSRA